jgi:flagellar hook-associated protein 1 FlgK
LNATAREIAEALSKRDGVEASARTTVEITDLEVDSVDFLDTEFTLNGVVLTQSLGPNQNQYEDGYPDEVPDPITLNFANGGVLY